MKIKIKRDLCCGAGLCAQIAPDVFRLDARGYNESDGQSVAPDRESVARKGANACPERAIHLCDDER